MRQLAHESNLVLALLRSIEPEVDGEANEDKDFGAAKEFHAEADFRWTYIFIFQIL